MKRVNLFLIISLVFLHSAVNAQPHNSGQQDREHAAVKRLLQQKSNALKTSASKIKKSDYTRNSFGKIAEDSGRVARKSYIMNGNKITTVVHDYSGIGPGGEDPVRNVDNMVWKNLGYVYQFGILVGGSVLKSDSEREYIISDGLNDYVSFDLQELDPITGERWQWEPIAGFADPNQNQIASNPAPDKDGDGKPDSWPRDWYDTNLDKYVWPGFLSRDATNADQEILWRMDDRYNKEFEYYPYQNDSTKQGLGLQVEGRAFQWSNALAENAIFFVYTITNISDFDLDSLAFGLYGDPDIGGGGSENQDDSGFFVPPFNVMGTNVDNIPVYARNMVYLWDEDAKGNLGLPLGYLGCKFLESPGSPNDNFDNDGDGMVDERQDDGIDNDGDWNPEIDDVGVDGIAGTDDEGEGDELPTAGKRLANGSLDPLSPGEPNFEFTDLDESDQIGLTSFNSWDWGADNIKNDDSIWERLQPYNPDAPGDTTKGGFGQVAALGQDIVFVFGSGYISLKKGETKRISMALLFGDDLDDLLITAETVQQIYNSNYRFFKPPARPTVKAVPGDKKVTLYWDTVAEKSVDPLTGKDFEGYVIYRSTDPDFDDIQIITDGKGSSFLSEPLKGVDGTEARFDIDLSAEPFTDINNNLIYDDGEPFEDLNSNGEYDAEKIFEDIWKGYHPVPYPGRGVQYFLGNNTGLRHSYVDSNNVINGQTYYYAVVAYDHGDLTKIPPSETTKKITVDPITNELILDDNTVAVIPGPRASNYSANIKPSEFLQKVSGVATGEVKLSILSDLDLVEEGEYELFFSDSMFVDSTAVVQKNYSVLDNQLKTEFFKLFGTNNTTLKRKYIVDDQNLKVSDIEGNEFIRDVDFKIDFIRGLIKRLPNSAMQENTEYMIQYKYYPVYQSTYLKGEDSNPVFDGLTVTVLDEQKIDIDTELTGWMEGSQTAITNTVVPAELGLLKQENEPGEYLITFSTDALDTAITIQGRRIPVNYRAEYVLNGQNERIQTYMNDIFIRNQKLDPSESIIFFKPGSEGVAGDTITWKVTLGVKADTAQSVILPGDGDRFFIGTKRPFTTEDYYRIVTTAPKADNSIAKNKLDDIYVVPNPYVGYSIIEPTTKLPTASRGERRIYFENLPMQCTIRIFSLSGNLVKKIEHSGNLENGREYWNLLNEDGFGVAYGVYIAHIDAPGVGEKIIKFALIK